MTKCNSLFQRHHYTLVWVSAAVFLCVHYCNSYQCSAENVDISTDVFSAFHSKLKMFRHRLNKINSTVILYRNCDELKKDFYSLKTLKDVARILDISYDRLIYHIHKVSETKKYKEFLIHKKSGKSRVISAPATA